MLNVIFSYGCQLPSSLARTLSDLPWCYSERWPNKKQCCLKKIYRFPCNFKNSLDCVVYMYVLHNPPSGPSAWHAPCPAWSSSGPPVDAAASSGAPSAARPAAFSGAPAPGWTGAATAAAMTATGTAASPDSASAGRSTEEHKMNKTMRETLTGTAEEPAAFALLHIYTY